MALDGLAGMVDREQVSALLLARAPGILDDESEDFSLFEETVRGVTTEVVPLIGSNPETQSPRRDLAVWAITMGVAAQLEAALFPEQQIGDGARAVYLDRRYQKLLTQLSSLPADDPAAEGATPPTGPRGSFPPPTSYPDPARGTYGTSYGDGIYRDGVCW